MPRKSAKHPGVSVFRRTDRGEWVASWVDAAGNRHRTSLDALGIHNPARRELWAVNKSRELLAEKSGLSAAPERETPIADAAAQYLDQCRAELRPNTVRAYSETIRSLLLWASERGVAHTEALSATDSADLRAWLVARYRRVPERGRGTKGKRRADDEPRSAHTVNRHLTTVAIIFGRWRAAGLTPLLSRDSISDTLRKLRTDSAGPDPLTPEALRQLLAACLRFDDRSSRSTHKRPVGVAPYAAFLLLSGCRANEGASLEWDAVDLGAGCVTISAGKAKTRQLRRIDLSVSPALAELLRVMQERRPASHTHVFGGAGPIYGTTLKSWLRWLTTTYGAPRFTWQRLRQTCASYLCNAPGIFGAASAFREAKQLGHSVTVAERHYAGVVRVAADARTLEAAMGVENEVAEVARRVSGVE